MLVLVNNRTEIEESEVQAHLDHCSRKSERFFAIIEDIIQEQSIKMYVSVSWLFLFPSNDIDRRMTDSLPSATKILQPGDVHIGSTGKYTFGSDNFRSKSGILHEARALQDRYLPFSSRNGCSMTQEHMAATRRYWKYSHEDRIHSIGIWLVVHVPWRMMQIPLTVWEVVMLYQVNR